MSIQQTITDLRENANHFCVAETKRFTPIGMINDYDRLVRLSQVMVAMKSIGIDTKNKPMRLMFWKKVFDVDVLSTDDVPNGYAIVFVNWVKNDLGVALRFGATFVEWYEKHHSIISHKTRNDDSHHAHKTEKGKAKVV